MPSIPSVPKGLGGLIGLVPSIIRHGQLTMSLLRDGRVPIIAKIMLAAMALWIVSPLDIPNFVPVLGQITDGFFVLLAMQAFFRLCPRPIVDEHIDRLGLRGKVRLLFMER